MKNFKKLNVGQICYVKSFAKQEYFHIEFQKEIKILGIVFKKEGFYPTFSIGSKKIITKEEIEKDTNLYCEGEKVYYKPHVEMGMSNGSVYTKFFSEEKYLFNFTDNYEMQKLKWINI